MKDNIFLYWDNKENSATPKYISLCFKTFIKNTSNFNLNILNDNNIQLYCDDIPSIFKTIKNLAHKSDIARVFALEKYGGMYFDMDTILLKDPLYIYDFLKVFDFVGFQYTKNINTGNYINGYFATKKNCIIMSEWKNQIKEKLNNYVPNCHTQFGEDILTEIIKKNIDKVKTLPMDLVFQAEKFNAGQMFDKVNIYDVINKDNTIAVGLFNNMFCNFEHVYNKFNLPNASINEILNKDCYLSNVFKYALKEKNE